MAKWEYLAFSRVGGSWSDDKFDGRSSQDKLSDLGADGWELVSVCYDSAGYNFYMKRAATTRKKAPAKKAKTSSKTTSSKATSK